MASKRFDAVLSMREIRDKMSAEMRGMSFDEQRAYIEQHAVKVRRELWQQQGVKSKAPHA
jgi:hypothetical protein